MCMRSGGQRLLPGTGLQVAVAVFLGGQCCFSWARVEDKGLGLFGPMALFFQLNVGAPGGWERLPSHQASGMVLDEPSHWVTL